MITLNEELVLTYLQNSEKLEKAINKSLLQGYYSTKIKLSISQRLLIKNTDISAIGSWDNIMLSIMPLIKEGFAYTGKSTLLANGYQAGLKALRNSKSITESNLRYQIELRLIAALLAVMQIEVDSFINSN